MSLSSVGVAPSSCPGREHQSREDLGWIPDAVLLSLWVFILVLQDTSV